MQGLPRQDGGRQVRPLRDLQLAQRPPDGGHRVAPQGAGEDEPQVAAHHAGRHVRLHRLLGARRGGLPGW